MSDDVLTYETLSQACQEIQDALRRAADEAPSVVLDGPVIDPGVFLCAACGQHWFIPLRALEGITPEAECRSAIHEQTLRSGRMPCPECHSLKGNFYLAQDTLRRDVMAWPWR